MSCVFEVPPFENGWAVKLCDTGEVLFFETRDCAKREATRLAVAYPGGASVRVLDLQPNLFGEWPLARAEILSRAGASEPAGLHALSTGGDEHRRQSAVEQADSPVQARRIPCP